jgi:hypothetical protein
MIAKGVSPFKQNIKNTIIKFFIDNYTLHNRIFTFSKKHAAFSQKARLLF